MKRNALLLLLSLATVAIAACAQSTAPRQDDPCSGYVTPAGECIPDSSATRTP